MCWADLVFVAAYKRPNDKERRAAVQMNRPIPITRDLVLLGGGHTHALVLKQWAMSPLPGAQVTLVNPQAKAVYTGMLPGYVAGHFARGDLDIDLVKLARQAGARLVIDRAVGIDTAAKRVTLEGRAPIAYDTLSVDIGITSTLSDLPGFQAHGVAAKPLRRFAEAWDGLITGAAEQGGSVRIAVIGAGAAGTELALAMAHRLKTGGVSAAKITLIDARRDILTDISGAARRSLMAAFEDYGIELVLGVRPKACSAEGVSLAGGHAHIPVDFIVSAAGARPHEWLSETGLDLRDGYISVDHNLRALSQENVFAVGDCAYFEPRPLVKAGVYAVRQAPVLFENIKAHLFGGQLKPYRPQSRYLKLITKGDQSAVADKWGMALSGGWVWRWKTRIDRAFMTRFDPPDEQIPTKAPSPSALGVADLMSAEEPPCGGCGAKVSRAALLGGLGYARAMDDAAILPGPDGSIITTDHLRAFTPDAYTLAKVAAVHALGDIWAMGAKPETALCNIILPPLAPTKQAQMLEEIMAGAEAVMEASGGKIVGGHTSAGSELTVGFSITGGAEGDPILQSGAQVGDALVLTKPIGSGTLLAAEMRQLADGDDVAAALEVMCRPMGQAAEILAAHATAMTDVTGFGLAGHLLTMLEASGVAAHLAIADIPFLAGAKALAEQGVRSSLWAANAEARAQMTLPASPQTDLLFDPQTCGGLLASVPAARIDEVWVDFAAAGEPIWQIGEVVAGAPHITVIG